MDLTGKPEYFRSGVTNTSRNLSYRLPSWEAQVSRYNCDDENNSDVYNETAALSEQLNRAVEELITGDSDDPPLSEEEVARMMNPG